MKGAPITTLNTLRGVPEPRGHLPQLTYPAKGNRRVGQVWARFSPTQKLQGSLGVTSSHLAYPANSFFRRVALEGVTGHAPYKYTLIKRKVPRIQR